MNLKTSHALIVALMVTLGSILFVGWWNFPEIPQPEPEPIAHHFVSESPVGISDSAGTSYVCTTGAFATATTTTIIRGRVGASK